MNPMRADQIKLASIQQERPGGIQPFMVPTKLKNQVRVGDGKTELLFQPTGKTPWGGTTWTIKMQRPGMLEPTIVAHKDQQAMDKMAANINAATAAPVMAPAPLPAPAAAPGMHKGVHKGMHKGMRAAAGAPAADAGAAATINATVAAVNKGASQVVPAPAPK